VTVDQLNRISGQIVDAAMEVHSELGPGLLESAYQACLSYELRARGFGVHCQLQLPLVYKEVQLDLGYRIDMLVDNAVVVETKSVEKLLPCS
jgi:GxxExxY protein